MLPGVQPRDATLRRHSPPPPPRLAEAVLPRERQGRRLAGEWDGVDGPLPLVQARRSPEAQRPALASAVGPHPQVQVRGRSQGHLGPVSRHL